MKESFPDRVTYTLFILKATAQDSGTYECSITHEISGDVRVSSVAVTVFGKFSVPETFFFWVLLTSLQQNSKDVEVLSPMRHTQFILKSLNSHM